ncbi:MAG: 1-(5-phosphoribosyl)-5-[(5-phosphoribosylamino)methylideneamino]imidazole-4-carboxamide isomerase [Gemmatimonadota bacterium]
MDILPAIDIRRGHVVRLSQGEAARSTAYETDPVAQAERFAADGAAWLHVVDLDRAFGDGENSVLIRRIAEAVGATVRIEVSGGIRSAESARSALRLPIARVVIGTAAVTAPGLVAPIVREFGKARVAVGLDARAGKLAIRGWIETSDELVSDVARRVIDAGVETIIYTDVTRDGMLTGPDIDGAVQLQALGARVIASGGISGAADVRAVRAAGLSGVIIGRALYEGRLTLAEALACA